MVCGKEDSDLITETTHVAFEHENFLIIRPLLNVYYRAKWITRQGNIYYAPGSIRTLIRHLQNCRLMKIEHAWELEEESNRAYTLIQEGYTEKAHDICKGVLENVEKEGMIEYA